MLGTGAGGGDDVRRGLVQLDGATVQVELDLRERTVGRGVLQGGIVCTSVVTSVCFNCYRCVYDGQQD